MPLYGCVLSLLLKFDVYLFQREQPEILGNLFSAYHNNWIIPRCTFQVFCIA
jgi:hypothetical protein